jgi:hypothetical protein
VHRRHRTAGDFRFAYGKQAYRAWRRGDALLNHIPRGQLAQKLDVGLLRQLNRLTYVARDEDFHSRVGNTLRGWLGSPIEPGTFRRYRSHSKVLGPFPPRQRALLCRHGCTLRRVPFRGGKVVVTYPDPATIAPRLGRLVARTCARLQDPDTDIIQLAADFTYSFIVLHPVQNGNGRVGRLVMDRILAERGLPPPILAREMAGSPRAFSREISSGVLRMIWQLKPKLGIEASAGIR